MKLIFKGKKQNKKNEKKEMQGFCKLLVNRIILGVLVVYIHSADDLNSDPSQCNPYCMLFNNRKKVCMHARAPRVVLIFIMRKHSSVTHTVHFVFTG